MKLHASIHDVMPSSLDRVEALAARLRQAGLENASLLIVPDTHWTPKAVERLRKMHALGHPLAGHGWQHRIRGFGSAYHRMHSLLLSRNAAEHLSLHRAEILALITRCRSWFDEQRLPAPELYVPPAWAMGPVTRSDLAGLGFRYYEFLSGCYDSDRQTFRPQALLGFEADTRLRKVAVRASNAINTLAGKLRGEARLAIHPQDAQLLLCTDLERWLRAPRASGLRN